MRMLCKVVLVAGMVALLAHATPAQQRGFGGGGMFGGGMLLGNKSVQEELKMTKEQTDKAQETLQKVMEKRKEAFAKIQDLGQDERQAKMRELQKVFGAE